MSCAEIQSELSAYRDDELTAQRREAVTTHLDQCADCCAYLRDIVRISDMLCCDSACQLARKLPTELWGRIAEAACPTPCRDQRIYRLFARAAAVAAGFALYVIGYGALGGAAGSGSVAVLASSTGVERMLHETALALAGDFTNDQMSALFEHTPETHLLRQLNKDAGR